MAWVWLHSSIYVCIYRSAYKYKHDINWPRNIYYNRNVSNTSKKYKQIRISAIYKIQFLLTYLRALLVRNADNTYIWIQFVELHTHALEIILHIYYSHPYIWMNLQTKNKEKNKKNFNFTKIVSDAASRFNKTFLTNDI